MYKCKACYCEAGYQDMGEHEPYCHTCEPLRQLSTELSKCIEHMIDARVKYILATEHSLYKHQDYEGVKKTILEQAEWVMQDKISDHVSDKHFYDD